MTGTAATCNRVSRADSQLRLPLGEAALSRFERFLRFHRHNPQVFALFVRFAREARTAGRVRLGARAIGERIRWYTAVETRSRDGYKVSDHFWPYYARLAMLVGPDEFSGFFERRDAHFDVDDETLLVRAGMNHVG